MVYMAPGGYYPSVEPVMYYQLVFRSEAFNVSADDVRDILRTPKKNNVASVITGCLVFRNRYFLHILEGEHETVKGLFYTAEDDNRHEQVTVLHEGKCEVKIFNDWDMVFLDLDEDQRSEGLKVGRSEFDGPMIMDSSDSLGFRVFWYNVQQLLTEQGFYSPSFDTDQMH